MIKIPLSTVIGGAFWTPGATVINGAKLSFETVMKKLFANGEQGFFYDPNDLSTMFQDATGANPVTAAGQPVGLVLDKSKGLVLGNELSNYSAGFSSLSGISPVGATLSLVGTALVVTAQAGISRRAEIPISGLTIGRFYKIKIVAHKSSVGNTQVFYGFTAFSKATYSIRVLSETATEYTLTLEATAMSGVIRAYAATEEFIGAQLIVESISVKEVLGNHAYQTTSAARPILQNNPNRIVYDGVDDKLTTNLPAQLTGCTVVRSAPNVGTQILTNQTIPATYEDNKDHCGLIVINRALTPSETSAIAAEFSKRAGV